MGTLRVKVTDDLGKHWVDVASGAGMRAGFKRRCSSPPSIPSGTPTAIPFTVVVDTSSYVFTANGASTLFNIPVAGLYSIHGNVAANNAVFPNGCFLMLYINGMCAARTAASRSHPFEDLRVSDTRSLAVGATVGLYMYQESGAAYSSIRTLATDTTLDPMQPALSCWRVSY
jgi:hypothetical protein